jgi:exo-beta-1,3-glucanase (GH17 family)/cellulose synthase/poly-beta-1,6-N-acetylglucosamine synthase-like glycosyltransferase
MKKSNVIITIAIAAVTVSLWAFWNQPKTEPPWPAVIQGFSFSPMRAEQGPISGNLPTVEEIQEDLALLSGKTHAIRTYTVDDVLGEIPALAQKFNINVCLGAWLANDLEKNEKELQRLLEIAGSNRNVVRVIVGNETLLRGEVPIDLLIGYLDRVRSALAVPVSTAEPWHVWIKHPELAEHVDYIGTHMLPYWEGVHLDAAVDYVVERTNQLKEAFPGLPVILAEVGWPSRGRIRKAAVATESSEAIFLRRFLDRAKTEKYTYYLMEAFDQPWKQVLEGAVGAYWGVYDVDRKPKFEFSEPIVRVPEWHILAALSVVLAAITLAVLLIDSATLGKRGRSFLAIMAYAVATFAVWIIYNYIQQYMTLTTVIVGILLLTGMTGVIIVLLTEGHEWAEARWVTGRRRPFTSVPITATCTPMVSIHVPCYNEPPDMVIETLRALSRLDYPDFEVLVIDNNTKDPEIWQPVETFCTSLGPRFRFFHVDPLSGYKAGALNYTLAHTSANASIIAVIDSDYQVHPAWLKDLVPQFLRPEVAVVQTPQDYRDGCQNAFKSMCYEEYKGFFYIGMVTRNDRNAIIQHGTMTMIRKSVLNEVGGWSEWCITEDAELGLRIFEHGYEAIYDDHSYGKGLMPDTFMDYKKQRFRWAYGAVQILRRHAGMVLGRTKSSLHYGQRYHFIAGWLPWLSDGVNLIFTGMALVWSLAMIIQPDHVDPPALIFSMLPLSLFCFKMGKLIYLYKTRVGVSVLQTVAAALAGLSLSHTISRAVLLGLLTTGKPFFRTPKMAQVRPFFKAIASAWEEFLLMLFLWTPAIIITLIRPIDTLDRLVWIIFLVVQSVPYASAVLVSFISGFTKLSSRLVNGTFKSP